MFLRPLLLVSLIGLLAACRDKPPTETTGSDATAVAQQPPSTADTPTHATVSPPEVATDDDAATTGPADAAPERPSPPPPPAVDRAALLKAIRASYPQAAIGAGSGADNVVITFGPGPTADNASRFTSAFLRKHQRVLAAGSLVYIFASDRGGHAVHTGFGNPPRDTGCRRARLAIELDGATPVSFEHTCERFAKTPPRYATRALPSSAKGSVDIVARVGWVGSIAGPLFSGFVLDRYGDVYEASDDLRPMGTEPKPFLDEYVKTLPKAEVEQFLADVAAAKQEPVSPPPPPKPDKGGAVVTAFVGTERVPLDRIDHPAARRAATWAASAVRR